MRERERSAMALGLLRMTWMTFRAPRGEIQSPVLGCGLLS